MLVLCKQIKKLFKKRKEAESILKNMLLNNKIDYHRKKIESNNQFEKKLMKINYKNLEN